MSKLKNWRIYAASLRAAVRKLKRPGKRTIVAGGLAACLLTAMLVLMVSRQLLGVGPAELPTLRETGKGVSIFDSNNHLLCTLHADRDRQPVPLSAISPNMRNAIVAAEDRRFYQHPGVDAQGIARALWMNYKAGRIVSGGSTITQQLARALYLDKEDKSIQRKLKEVFLSWDIDQQYSKAKILETYLNEIYFGGGVYGIERASNHYFNKRAAALSASESAFLAGIVRSPSILGAPRNRKAALARQLIVLKNMQECGYLSQDERTVAQSSRLAFKPGRHTVPHPYYVAYVMQIVQRELGDDLWRYNWNVYTHLHMKTQEAAESILGKGIASAPNGINQGALVTMSVKDGAILAIVGGVGKQAENPWNRALFPHTAGSAFKPFVYLSGLIDGIIQPDTIVDDSPLTINDDPLPPYEPKNFDGRFLGWMPVRSALAMSRNVCAARMAQEVGLTRVVEVAHAAGIKSQLDPYPSLALGACAVSPLDMTTAYATLARSGVRMEPQLVRRIHSDDTNRDKVFQATPRSDFPAEPVRQLVDAMQDVVRSGTGTQARLPGIAVAGKTGTADKSKDIWFVGFTPDTVTAVWGGNDKNVAVQGQHVTGGGVMAGIWRQYMTAFYRLHKPPTGIAFAAPSERLASSMPGYDYYEPVTVSYDSGDPQIARAERAVAHGVGRASDVQRLVATGPAIQRQVAWFDNDQTNSQEDSDYNPPHVRAPSTWSRLWAKVRNCAHQL